MNVNLRTPILLILLVAASRASDFSETADKKKAREIMAQVYAGDISALDEIAKLAPSVAVPILQIPAIHNTTYPAETARARAALRTIEGAVPYLEEVIMARIAAKAQDPGVLAAFETLAVLGSKNAIRMTAPLLFNETILRSGMADVADSRVDLLAAETLGSMELADAPKSKRLRRYHVQDVEQWRKWWIQNHARYGVTDVPPITKDQPIDKPASEAHPVRKPTPAPPINLARTSLAKVWSSRVNGDRKQDDVYYGVLNAFDAGRHFFKDISYSSWHADPRDGDPWIQVRFTAPVTVMELSIEPLDREFRAELFGEKEKLGEVKGTGTADLPTPESGVHRVRIHFDRFLKQDPNVPQMILEVHVIGLPPDGQKHPPVTPRVDLQEHAKKADEKANGM